MADIMEAADRLFQSRPYHQITMGKIATELGWSRSNLYKYAATQEEIFLALFQREYELFAADLEGLCERGEGLNRDSLASELARTLERKQEADADFNDHQKQQLQTLMTLCEKALTQMNTVMHGHRSDHDIRESFRIENDINQLRQQLKGENVQAVNDHEYDYAVGTLYVDMVNELEKLGDYVINVVEARFGK
jgi:AcrR family transcriptional regulator